MAVAQEDDNRAARLRAAALEAMMREPTAQRVRALGREHHPEVTRAFCTLLAERRARPDSGAGDDALLLELVDALRPRRDSAEAMEALRQTVLEARRGPVRRAAVHALRSDRDPATTAVAAHAVAHDPSPFVRRSAVELLGERRAWQPLVNALTDPVYRVRRQAIGVLARFARAAAQEHDAGHHASPGERTGEARSEALCAQIASALAAQLDGAPAHLAADWRYRADGALRLLASLSGTAPPTGEPVAPPRASLRSAALDPATLRDQLVHGATASLAADPQALSEVFVLQDGYPVAALLDEARWHAVAALRATRSPQALLPVLRALDDPRVPDLERWCRHLLADQPAELILGVRRELEAVPGHGALRLLERLDEPAPEPAYWPRRQHSPLASFEEPARVAPVHGRTLAGEAVSPLAISGRYGLAPEAFAHAMARGVDTFFWEPEYTALTALTRSLPAPRRASLRFVAGSFRGGAEEVRRDLETARDMLGVERLTVFLLFWVRSLERLGDEVLEMLVGEVRRGRIGAFGLSTHDRGIAGEGLARGAQVVMLRHNAAHRGAETSGLLREVDAVGADAIAFNCTSYGQLLSDTVRAPDCYRYCLSQPGVRIALCAPRTLAELEENLEVLEQPTLDEAALERMRGEALPLAARNREFAELVRWR